MSFAADGRRVVSGSDDGTVRVWDAESGAELLCLSGHTNRVTAVSFAADGRRVVSGSADQTVRVWDAESGAELLCLNGHTDTVWSVSFAADGRRVVSGSFDKTVRVWDAGSGAELLCLSGHTRRVTPVRFAADGRRVVSGSDDRTVRVWDAVTGECLEIHEGTYNISAVALMQASSWAASDHAGETRFQCPTGETLAYFPELVYFVYADAAGRTWAGSISNAVYLLRLEGDLPDQPTAHAHQQGSG